MENKKHNIPSLKEMFDYISKRMLPGKRHSFEKKMQKDPFLEDALEGLSMLDEEKAEREIKKLNRRIINKEKSRTKLWITSIAAGIALIAITSITFIAIENTRKSLQEMQLSREEIPDILTSDSAAGYLSEEKTSTTAESTENEIQPAPKSDKKKPAEKAKQISEPVIADYEYEEITIDAEASLESEPEVIYSFEEQTLTDEDISMIIVQDDLDDLQDVQKIIRGRVVDSDNMEGIPGVSIVVKDKNIGAITDVNGYFEIEYDGDKDVELTAAFVGMRSVDFTPEDIYNDSVLVMENEHLALQEVVVVGYGTTKRSKTAAGENDTDKDHIAPVPEDGYKKYKRYLNKNAILPDTADVTTLTIELSFDVDEQGKATNFEIIESPSEEYSEKAIELIKNGPSWRPATVNDAVVVEKVILEILFRK